MGVVTVAIERHYSFVDHIELVFGSIGINVTEDLVVVVFLLVIVHQVVDLVRRLLDA
jgi:hypothetical protein